MLFPKPFKKWIPNEEKSHSKYEWTLNEYIEKLCTLPFSLQIGFYWILIKLFPVQFLLWIIENKNQKWIYRGKFLIEFERGRKKVFEFCVFMGKSLVKVDFKSPIPRILNRKNSLKKPLIIFNLFESIKNILYCSKNWVTNFFHQFYLHKN